MPTRSPNGSSKGVEFGTEPLGYAEVLGYAAPLGIMDGGGYTESGHARFGVPGAGNVAADPELPAAAPDKLSSGTRIAGSGLWKTGGKR